jgi:hypothetical protein
MFAYDHVRVVRLDDILNPAYGYPEGSRDAYFAKNFPSSGEIEEFLLNTTLVISKPPRGNEVYYFSKDHKLVLWHDKNIEDGEWWSSPKLQILILGQKRRFAVVQSFCISFLGPAAAPPLDNCYSVEDVESLLSRGLDSRKERVTGNPFNLGQGNSPPFDLPKSEISIASLLRSIQDKGR